MLQHYIKIAFRQIAKNKVQYLLSIIGIAIGLLCFSVTSYYMRRYNNQFTAWENKDRMARISTTSDHDYTYSSIPGKALQGLATG